MYSNEVLVSVIIPVYNVEKYLEQCIDSVLNQTYENLEIFLIDDSSTDNSFKICQNKAHEDNRIKIIQNEKNQGQSISRNKGIASANGKYIYFLDSDDYIYENLFECIIPFMEKTNLEMCYFSAEVLLEGNDLSWNMETYMKKHKYKLDIGKEVFNELYKSKEYTPSCCMFITKASIIKNNDIYFRNNIFYEDNFFAFQLAMKSRKSFVMNDVFYVRRVRPGSTMTSRDKKAKKIYSCKKVINDFSFEIKKNGKSIDRYIKYIIRSFSANLIYETYLIGDKNLIKESRMFLWEKKFYLDYKVFGYAFLKLYLHVGK